MLSLGSCAGSVPPWENPSGAVQCSAVQCSAVRFVSYFFFNFYLNFFFTQLTGADEAEEGKKGEEGRLFRGCREAAKLKVHD